MRGLVYAVPAGAFMWSALFALATWSIAPLTMFATVFGATFVAVTSVVVAIRVGGALLARIPLGVLR